jgi:tRNA pseudouridine38-40 synthase
MTRIRLLVSYDGTDYCGWQKQKQHKHASPKPSIQETLEKALSQIFNEPIEVMGSGRTDAGVHALGQVCHFETSRENLPRDLCWAVKALLPASIAVKDAWIAPEEFHATLSATHKTYRYWVWNSPRPTALLARYSNWIRNPLDLEYLNRQAEWLVGEKDFKSFQSVGTEVLTTVRKIYQARWVRKKNHMIEFQVTGSGFLKQMVRNIVGTQLDLCQKGQPVERIGQILEYRDRTKAGPAAAPQGLFLSRVYYPQDLDKRCRQI